MTRRVSTRVAGLMVVVYLVAVTSNVILGIANGNWQHDIEENISMMLAFMAFMAVGAVIVARRPGNALGWVFCAIGLLAASGSLAMEYAEYAYITRPGAMPASVLAAWYASWFWYPLILLVLLYTLMLFPTGRVPSPRWRPLAWGAGAVIIATTGLAAVMPTLGLQDFDDIAIPNPIGIAGVGNPENGAIGSVLFALTAACMLAAVLSLVVRFRRSRGQERLQLKWFAYAATLVIFLTLSEELWQVFLPPFTSGLVIALLPAAVGVAVLRYRLYDIDRIISRTVSYALITAVLVGVYVLVAVVPATLFNLESDLLAAAATLAAAAAFGPVRRRVQTQVDRRFNRSRYNALQTADAFRARLRHTVDLEDLSTDLLTTVGTTVQPERATVWLRPTSP